MGKQTAHAKKVYSPGSHRCHLRYMQLMQNELQIIYVRDLRANFFGLWMSQVPIKGQLNQNWEIFSLVILRRRKVLKKNIKEEMCAEFFLSEL